MKNRTNVLLGIAVIIGTSISSFAYAVSIHDVLANEPFKYYSTTSKSVTNPQTIQDYVNNFRISKEAGESRVIAGVSETTAGDWQKALGNPVKL